MKKLHVLNGDSTLLQFNKVNINGEKFVWREILCEGETTASIGTELFWKQREKYLASFSKGSKSDYIEKFKNPFIKLNLSNYGEIILWFEYDLFCQINLIAVLSWLNNQRVNGNKVSLICLGEHKNYKKLVGLGEIDSEEYYKLYQQRIELTKSDLKFGEELWNLYLSKDHVPLLALIERKNNLKFKYLLPAIKTHLKRFPDNENGLSEIENNIVQYIKSEFKARTQIVEEMLRRENYYGFGDSQYFDQLENLKPILLEEDGKFTLNELGKLILDKKFDFMEIRKKMLKYGGANLEEFRWNGKEEKLIKFKTGY